MAKDSKFLIDLDEPLPEWGVSPKVSKAVPIAASGAEIRSTRGVSEAIHRVLLSKVSSKVTPAAMVEFRNVLSNAKKQKGADTFVFKQTRRASRSPISGTKRKK